MLDKRAYESGVELKLIQAGKPTQNSFIDSFGGDLGDECLSEHWLHSSKHARAIYFKYPIQGY